jgi:hypothetical protein
LVNWIPPAFTGPKALNVKETLKRLLKYSPIGTPLRSWLAQRWDRKGRPVPPPSIIKERTLRSYAEQYSLKILVETGTFRGDMVNALKDSFIRIYSIELDDRLFNRAIKRFKAWKHIHIMHGDSGKRLPEVIEQLDQPTLFWLDAHYSAGITARGQVDTPIFQELEHIFSSDQSGHVIVIDDARCFGTDPAYPTLEELREFVQSKRKHADMTVKDDSIRIVC